MDDNMEIEARKQAALLRLDALLPAEVLIALPDLVEEVLARTGFGNVRIIISEYRVIAPQLVLGFPKAKREK